MTYLLTLLNRPLSLIILMFLTAGAVQGQSATGGYAGGDLTYQMGNGDTLNVTLNYYLDCGGSSPGSNPFLILRNCSGTPLSTKNMGSPTITEISNTTQTTNCGAGSISGRRRYQYTAQIDISAELGSACNFYRLTISPNTRNVSQNLSSSTSQRMWLQADIYVQNDATNSSPVFGGEAIPYVCSGSTVGYAPEVSDADGDSLRFSLVSAQGGTTSASNLTYLSGSGTAPISGISIDPTSGVLSFTSPNDSGNYQTVIQVDEYDPSSGNQISRTYRDFQFHIDSTCTNDGPVPAAAFSNVSNASTVGNDTVIIDTGDAAVFRLLFTDGGGISGYTSNAVSVLGGNATFNSSNAQITWTPGGNDIGTHIITIAAEDNVTPISGKGAQTIVVVVQASTGPFLVTNITPSAQTCLNPANGQIVVNFTGGTGPFMFAVEGNFTGATDTNNTGVFSGLGFDVYRVYAIDSSTLSDTLTGFNFTVLQSVFQLNSFTILSTVTCDDDCDGRIRANPNGNGAGGNSLYTYLWDDGQTTRIAEDVCGGTRIVTITDTAGCALIDTAILFEPPATFAVLDSSDSVSCFGSADGEAYIGAHGGVAASSSTSRYLIDQTEGSFEPYPYGQPFNVSNANYDLISLGDDAVSSAINIGFNFEFFGNTFTQFQISSNGFITLGSTNTDNGCCSGETLPDNTNSPQNVIAAYWEDLNPSLGGTIETYRLNNGSNDVRVINFVDVGHFLTGSTVGDSVTFQIVLYENSNIIQIYGETLQPDGGTHTQGIENAAGDTAFFVSGRNAANWSATNDYVAFIPHQQSFTYTWSSIGSGASATNLTAGTYSVIATDGDGCGDTVNFTIESPTQIDIDTTITQPSCAGDTNGQIAVTATGGNGGPYTFAWSTGATGSPLINIGAGTYTVTATDVDGCIDSLTIVIADPAAITISFDPDSVSCLGGNDGQITATGAGGTSGSFTYAWSTGSTANPLTGLTADTYTVTATDGNGCSAVDSATVLEPATAVTVSADSTDESCSGASDGTASSTASGGTGTITFAWSNGATTQNITGLTADTYTVTATDANGCTATATTVVNAPASGVSVSIVDSTNVSCNGGNDGQAVSGTPTGGTGPYTLLWNTGSSNDTIFNLTAGTYTVTAEDANGCEGTDQVVITEPALAVTASITLDSNASCNGAADGGLTASGSGGTGTITFAWSTGATSATITGLTADNYTVTVTDANGCTDTSTQGISEPTAVSASIATTQPTCSGGTGSATASGSGGTGTITFTWSNGATTATITGLTADTYTVTATDANGCTDTASTVITNGTAIGVSFTTDSVDCLGGSDGSATANAIGATGTITYAWNNGGSSQTISSLTAGNYTVTITDGNGCTATGDTTVFEPATGVSAGVGGTNISCNGEDDGVAGAAGSGGTPGYTYSWSTGGTADTITGLSADTYTVTVTDANGCTAVDSVTITEPSVLFAFTSVIDQPTCNSSNDGVIQAFGFGGSGSGYTYAWSTGPTTAILPNLTAGTYTVTVTDGNGCTDTEDETLTAPNPIALTSDTASESCPGAADGEAYVFVTGGTTPYTYSWTTGSTNDTITGLTAGSYTVTVTDSNNCVDSITVTIDAGAGVTLAMSNTPPQCNGDTTGTATATATGSGTLTFAWSNGGSTATITSLTAGTYTVTVTDANGCQAIDSTTLVDPTLLTVTATGSNPTCSGGTTGSATATGAGGTGTITFAWSNGGTGATITGLTADTYTVTATDANGCTATDTALVSDPTALVATGQALLHETCAEDDGQATVNVTGAQGTPTFSWTTGATSQTITGLSADTYTVTVTDGSGCTDTAAVVILDTCACAVVPAAVVTTPPTCAGDSATVTASATGGSGTYTFLWPGGATTASTQLPAGTWCVTIDDGSCSDTACVIVSDPNPITFSAFTSITEISCDDACDGAGTANASGGTGTLFYTWSSGSVTASENNLCGGSYTVTVTDGNGCTNTAMFALVEPPSIWAVVDSTDSASCGTADGQAYLSAYGGFAVPTSTAAYVVDSTEGEFEPYGIGEPLNANSYEVVTLQDDALSDTIEVFAGGNFSFFGSTETHFVICSQGFITFDASNINSGQVNGMFSAPSAIPNTGGATPREFIAGFWTDLDPSVGTAKIETYEIGTAPNRARVVNYIDVTHFAGGGNTDTNNFQIVLYESSNIIQIHSTQLRNDGGSAVQGIENAAGTIAYGLSTRNNTVFDADDDYVAFIPTTQAFTYSWSSIGTGASATNLTAGQYTVTVDDGNACTDVVTFDIFELPSAVDAGLSIDAGVSCTGTTNTGELSVSPSGGTSPYTQLWSTGATGTSINSLSAGTYSVVVTDDNGCTDTAQVTLSGISTSIASPTILTNDTSICPGTSLLLEGQTNSSSTYTDTTSQLCTNTSGGVVTAVFSNVPATAVGNATLSITAFGDLDDGLFPENITVIDENSGTVGTYDGSSTQCATATETFTITAANINSWAANNVISFVLDAGFFVTANSCSGNAFCATVALTFPTAPDTSYWFEDPLNLDTALAIGFGDTVTVSPTTNTRYYYSTFNGLCWSEPDSVDVDTLPSLIPSIAINTNINCPGDSASVTASATGGSGTYNFTWPNGETTATVLLPAGSYCVTIDDGLGSSCSDTACITLVDPSGLSVSASSNDPLCNGQSTGSATAAVTGGSGTITYNWNTGGTTPTITGLSADTYTVVVTDANGCTATDTTLVDEPDPFVLVMSSDSVSCNGGNDGEGCAALTGGTPNYTYSWSDGSTGICASNVPAGTFTVTITDANGCTISDTIDVFEPAVLIATIDSTDSNDCFGAADGVAYASGSAGTSPYSFAWPNGSTSDTASGLTAGTYEVTITDANGCTETATATITQPATGMTISITNTDSTLCNGGTDGAATALAVNGSGTITYAWSNGDNGATTTSGLSAGTYGVTATDATGCTASTTATIEEPTPLVIGTPTVTPVSCNGGNDGAIGCLPVSGGTPGYTYSWATGSTLCSVNGLTAGNYSVTVTDANGCTATPTAPINVTEPNAVDVVASSTNINCNGNGNGTASAAATGGTGVITFTWTGGATTSSIGPLTAGVYYVTATDANGCSDIDSATILEPTLLIATIDSTDSVSCFGGNDGVAYASASGGTAPYSFAWPNGSTSDTASGLTAGTYIVTITDDSNCTETATAVVGGPATGMTINITNTDSVTCGGGNDGAATALANNAQGTVSYLWSNGDNTATTTSGLTAGTYGVTSTDASGCTASTTATIFEPAAIIVSVTGNDPSCNGFNDGDATSSVTNGVGTLSYNWSNGATTPNLTGLTADTYILVVTDGNGCTGTDTLILSDPAGMTASFSGIVESSCTSCTGEATVTVTGGAATLSYLWPNSQTNAAATALCDGINQVTVTDGNGCVDSFAVFVPADSADTVIAMGQDPFCAGSCDGMLFTSNTCTGCTFNWIDSATSTSVGTTDTVNNRCAGTYYVEMTNTGGCTSIDTITLVDPAGMTVVITSFDTVSCLGGNDGTATANATGGTGTITYTWSEGSSGATVTGLTAGTFTVYATDANGCVDSTQVVITEPATGLSVVASIDSNVSCNGFNDGGASAVASGGSGTLTFTWNGTLNGATITGLTAGTYTVVVSDAGACTATDSVTILEPTAVVGVIDSTSNPTCPGDTNGQATVHGTGGSGNYTYLWPSGNTGTTELNLPDGVHCVTITDDSGCVDILCVTITDPAGMTNTFSGITLSSCTVCDGDATANVSGGNGTNYTYIWGNGQTTATNDSLCAGVNNVTITDSLGCTLVDAVAISADGADTVFADSIDATCGSCDGTVYATYNCTNGPCVVNWTAFGSTTSIGTTDTINNLCAGVYFVELTNNNGCTSTAQTEVIAPDPIDPNDTITNESCAGAGDGSIVLNPLGGSGTFSYAWSNGAGNVANNTSLTAGTYTVTISDNAGCDTIAEFVIDAPTGIVITDTSTNASCFGVCDGTITLNPTGGAGSYTYNWSPIPGNGNGVQAATGLCANDYFVTVTDANGCFALDTITITSPNEIVQDTAIVTDATCGDCDGTITSTISGGAGGFSYSWTNGDTTNLADSLCFGFYELTVTDASGCFEVFGYPVSESDGPEITLSGVNTSASGQCDGTATATVTSSLGTVVFVWSNGDTTATADSLCAGLYVVTVTDTNGCSTVDTITITEPDAMSLALTVVDPTCAGGPCNGEITAVVAGGVLPYTYAWSNGDTTQTITDLCGDTYIVTVTDGNGNIIIDSATLASPSAFTITSVVQDLTCPGVCDGSITLNISGGSPTILWSTGDTINMIDSLCAGTYSVTVLDTSGCNDTLTFDLTTPPDIVVVLDSLTEPDCQTANGMIAVTASGGSGGPYTYQWLDAFFAPLVPNQTTNIAVNLLAGIYNVVVADSNGCLDTFNFILNNNNAPDIALDSIVNVSCFGECDGAIYVSLSGGTTPYVYQWSSGSTAEDDTSLCAGFDTLAVADANLCLSFEIYEVVEPTELILEPFDITSVVCGSNCDGAAEANASGGSAPYSYSWSNGATDSALTDLCAGVYDVTITDANGCTVSGSANVSGPSAMVLTTDSTEDATCDYTGDGNIFVTVTGGTPGYTYSWEDDDANAFANQDLTNILAGTYMLTVTDANGCTVSDTFDIGTLFFVSVEVDDDFEVCPDSRAVPISGTDSSATSVRWLNALGIVQSNGRNALVDALEDTNMFVFEGTNDVCVARDTIYIYETEGPGVDAGGPQTIEPGGEVTIGGDPTARGGIEVTWTPNTDITSISEYNPIVNPLKTTMYYVSAIDGDECYGIDSVLITVEKVVDPVGGFSPNNDGVNELFIIDRIDRYPNATVQIFNRWGNLLFSSAPGYPTPWNGTYNGNSLPVGTYYYIIDLKDDDVDEIITGPVSILK